MIDALWVVSFGGPEGMADVMPFLDNVLRGRNVPQERKLEVAHHYELFNGVSPISAQNRELITALEKRLEDAHINLPIFFGNRNWAPYIFDSLVEMKKHGVRRALVYVTSAFESYSGSTQYMEDIANAQKKMGEGFPEIVRLPQFYNHPLFIQANARRIEEALVESGWNDGSWHLAFTAHSVPISQAEPYQTQLMYTCRQVAEVLGHHNWNLIYQSRSGAPNSPWLEPDILDHLKQVTDNGEKRVMVMPIGFVSDHMEVKYDLDIEAKALANQLGIEMCRAPAVGSHPLFVDMLMELIGAQIGS